MSLLEHSILKLEKRVPLTVSYGTQTHSTVIWFRWQEEGIEGWGETTPFAVGEIDQSLESILAELSSARTWLGSASAWERHSIETRLRKEAAPSALIAGITLALLDWMGKRLGQPVWRLLGLAGEIGPVTSVTVGISSPEMAVKRIRDWRAVGDVRAFKVKLGSPAGIAADQAMFGAVRAEVPTHFRLSVDANGGWSVEDAQAMSVWLADRGVDHLEQPLARGQESMLPAVRKVSPLPIIVDESIFDSRDIPSLVGRVDGINIKLMKCGGIDEALRTVAAARAHGMQLLVGCYGNTALANCAAATLGPLVDYLDLDSHLNLKDDPFNGAQMLEGRLALPAGAGFGISRSAAVLT